MQVESVPLTTAVQYKQAHVDLNPDHVLILAVCGDCDAPIGIICRTCREPVCAISDDGHAHA